MNKGHCYALVAALLNAFVGVFSLGAFATGLPANSIAFLKCFVALILLVILLGYYSLFRQQALKMLPYLPRILLTAFCGFFMLYYFETRAYQYIDISNVVFTLLGASTITTFIVSRCILKTALSLQMVLSILLALLGLSILYSKNLSTDLNLGMLYAALAGIGYGLFLVLNKTLPPYCQGVALLFWLVLGGTSFLFIPCLMNGITLPTSIGWLNLLALGGASTLGGFYCTTKALSFASATTVQLFELNEPFFASILGMILYHQMLTMTDGLGALCVFLAIIMASRADQKNSISISSEQLS